MTPVPMQDNSIFSHNVYGKIFLRAKCFYSYFITKKRIFCNCKYFDFKHRRRQGGEKPRLLVFTELIQFSLLVRCLSMAYMKIDFVSAYWLSL